MPAYKTTDLITNWTGQIWQNVTSVQMTVYSRKIHVHVIIALFYKINKNSNNNNNNNNNNKIRERVDVVGYFASGIPDHKWLRIMP